MALPSPEVLVVEDDPDMNEMLGAYVQLAGFEYRPALDGSSALAAMKDRLPALVLLDLMLPDIDGLEVCQRMRADEATRETPVVILSARDEPEARRRAALLAVREYLTKPFDPDALIASIRKAVADGSEA
ncbi:MAG: response regulator [Polyangiales bacterium]